MHQTMQSLRTSSRRSTSNSCRNSSAASALRASRFKNDYRARCSKSGRRFIAEFLQDINDHPMGTNSATAMQKIIDGMLTAGCEATVASFLALTEKVRVWNKCQVKAKILPEDQLAEKFKDLVIRMGEVAENKLQITINNAVMQTMVRKGDVDAAMPKIIMDSCCIVLGDLADLRILALARFVRLDFGRLLAASD